MATYIILNTIIGLGVGLFMFLRHPKPNVRHYLITMSVMILCTAVFDSIIIGTGIVDYDYAKTLRLKIGLAPIEDFMYTLVAGMIMPYLWERFKK